MIKFIRQNLNFEIVILLLISLVPLFWFQKDHVILGLDSGYAIDHLKFFLYRIHTWMPNPNFGVDMSAEMGLLPLVSLPAFISLLGVSIFNVQKILLVVWFFVLAVSMYIFVRELFPKKDQWIIRLSAVFIFVFNFHLYSFLLQAEQPMITSYVILPLFALILYRFAVHRLSILKTAALLGVIYLLFNSGGIRGIPLIAPVILTCGTLFIYFSFINWKKEGFGYVKRFIVLFIAFVLFAIPLNAYWIFPFLGSFSHEFNTQVTIAGGIDGAISWARFISGYDSFVNLFRLHGDNNWYSSPQLWSKNYLTNPFLIVASFVFPILAFAAPIVASVRNDRKIILFFVILALLSLLFAAGAHPPFGDLYVFMMEKIPGFATFRSAYYKFMPAVYFSFAIMIGYSVYMLTERVKGKLKIIIQIAFLIFILVYHYPYFQNTNATFNKPFTTLIKIPDYVYEFQDFITNDPSINGKTLVIPQSNFGNTIKAYKWGYYGSYSLFALMTDKPFVQYDGYLFNDGSNKLISTIYKKLRNNDLEGFKRATKITGIKHVLVTNDVAYDYGVSPVENPARYISILSDKKYFKQVWSRGEWTLYQIVGEVQKPVNVQSGVAVISPNSSGLESFFSESSLPFVFSDLINKDLLEKLPKKERLINYNCLSCALYVKEKSPDLPYSLD